MPSTVFNVRVVEAFGQAIEFTFAVAPPQRSGQLSHFRSKSIPHSRSVTQIILRNAASLSRIWTRSPT